MNKQEFNALVEKFEEAAGAKISEALKTELKGLDIDALKKLLEKESVSKIDFDELKGILEEQGEVLTSIKNKGQNFSNSAQAQINKFIEDNHDNIKNIKAAGHGVIELEVKAVGSVTTGSGTNTNPPTITGTQQAPLSNVNLRGANLLSLTSNVNTSLAAYPYTETVPKDGDYSFLSEGDAATQIDMTWETNYAKPVKASAFMRLTDESIQDVAGIQSVANDLLRKKHDLKKQKGILFGDGTAPNPLGATVIGRAFVAGAMANKVTNPNFMDIINSVVTDISNTHNFEDETDFIPSLVVVNPIDFFIEFASAKDGEGKPLYPTASLFNVINIGGLTIIPDRSIPVGKIFCADMSKYNTTNYQGYTVKIGYVNEDFIKGQFVIVAYSRFHAFVKKLEKQAFVYDDIATIKTAITKV
ncbi:phage major capsid family protein [Tenacibaculum maritimum]|uniref:phage major capsid family protein n=1 Tax=Tenacibaculum maritimum TaxID=107401 RepID=UPI003876D60E